MDKDPKVEALSRLFEQADTECYEWTDEQFEIWWERDNRNKNHQTQRARARLAIKFLDDYENKGDLDG